MYDRGFGTYNETARSFYNVNPVFNPEDNGRAAPQFQTQHVPIFNPALTQEHMYAQAEMSRQYLQTGGIVNLATRGMHAENYSLLESQAKAKQYSNIMSGLGRITSVASLAAGLAGPLGIPLMAGAYFGEQAFDKYKRYYEDYSTRMGNIAGLRSHFSNVGGGIVNPYTGVMSGMQASNLASGFASAAQGAGFSEQDMYTIHTMASQSGLMDGYNGSVSSVTSRVATLAKVTRSIMKLGEGIDQHTAMEMQRLTETMEIDLGKFQNLDIASKVVSAARLTKKSIQATNAMIESAAAASSQAGLGGQMGAESALFMSRYAAPQFSNLSAAQQKAVGGSADAYVQNLVSAQVNYASRNASTLALGSYYVDPTTGQLKVDTNEVAAMAYRGFNPQEEYQRGMNILDKDARQRLKDAGISQSFVTNALQANIGRLGKEAINSIDNDLQSAMSLNEIVRTAADNGMTYEQAAASLGYSDQQASALKAFGENFGKGSKFAREEDRKAYLQELRTRNASSAFISNSQRRNTAERDAERAAANAAAARDAAFADRAREEELGIYGGRRRSYTDAEITGALFGEYDVISGRGGLGAANREGQYRFGTYSGRREKDIGRGLFSRMYYGGEQGKGFGLSASVADRAVGKEVLSKIYRDDFYGSGTSVTNEGIFGQDNSIMARIAQGTAFSTDNLNTLHSGKDAIGASLAEIFGKRKSLSDYGNLIQNEQARSVLMKYGDLDDLTSDQAEQATQALASVATSEIAAFSSIGRSLRTQGSRGAVLSKVESGKMSSVNRAAEALSRIVNSNASTNGDFKPKNNSEDAIQTSRAKMAKRIFEELPKGTFNSEAEVLQALPQILARSYGSNSNTAKLLDTVFSVAETAKGMAQGDISLVGGSTVLADIKDMTVVSLDTLGEAAQAKDMYGGKIVRSPWDEKVSYSLKKSLKLTSADFVLGGAPEGDSAEQISESITEKSIALANTIKGVSKAKGLGGQGAAQQKVADISYRFLDFINKLKIAGDGTLPYDSIDQAYEAFIYQSPGIEKLLRSLDPETRRGVVDFVKQQASNVKLEGQVGEGGVLDKEKYTELVGAMARTGAGKINREAIEDFLEGSKTAVQLFGSDSKTRTEKAMETFRDLSSGRAFSREGVNTASFMKAGGGVDISKVLTALGFSEDTMDPESYEQVRELAAASFGGGNFGEKNQLKFAKQLQTMIQNGKVRSVGGVGGNESNAPVVQQAVDSLFLLQTATAQLLTALTLPADEGKNKLSAVANTLKSLQTPKAK